MRPAPLKRTIAKPCKQPKMRTGHKGATWDRFNVVLPNSERTDGFIDTSWGSYVYFEYAHRWWKADHNKCRESRDGKTIYIDQVPFS